MPTVMGQLKLLMKNLMGKVYLPPIELVCQKKGYGSHYGGWEVASGQLSSGSVVYSFGVGQDISFDLALIEEFGLTVHAFDPTPSSIRWVHEQDFPSSFVLHEFGLADFDGEALFSAPLDSTHVSHTVLPRPGVTRQAFPVRKLSTIMNALGHSQIDLLKMDIEGAEYSVIDDLAGSNIRPTQILIEFHHSHPGVGLEKTKAAVDKIRGVLGYRLFSISASGYEYGFMLQQ